MMQALGLVKRPSQDKATLISEEIRSVALAVPNLKALISY